MDALGASAGPVARGSVARVGLATAISAACGYAVLYLAARNLDPAGFSVFGVFWGAFGLVTGAANGLLQEAARDVRANRATTPVAGGPHTNPMRVAFGPQYQTSGTLLAWLTAAAVSIAVLTLTGSATVAAALHRAYALGWVAATVAAAGLLTLPLDLATRTVVALLCGPLVGIAVHLAALARAGD